MTKERNFKYEKLTKFCSSLKPIKIVSKRFISTSSETLSIHFLMYLRLYLAISMSLWNDEKSSSEIKFLLEQNKTMRVKRENREVKINSKLVSFALGSLSMLFFIYCVQIANHMQHSYVSLMPWNIARWFVWAKMMNFITLSLHWNSWK